MTAGWLLACIATALQGNGSHMRSRQEEFGLHTLQQLSPQDRCLVNKQVDVLFQLPAALLNQPHLLTGKLMSRPAAKHTAEAACLSKQRWTWAARCIPCPATPAYRKSVVIAPGSAACRHCSSRSATKSTTTTVDPTAKVLVQQYKSASPTYRRCACSCHVAGCRTTCWRRPAPSPRVG